MFTYKTKEFYTQYCSHLDDFLLVADFEEDKDRENAKMYYLGTIMPTDTKFRIQIDVKIPLNFPHSQLRFYTKSISGYPHLIQSTKISDGSWFCLNTAFAETAKLQLDEEFNRLREWLKQQLIPNLPKYITDNKAIYSLQRLNAYEGDNHDEIEEMTIKPKLTFVGETFQNAENYPIDSIGHFQCVKHKSGKIFVYPKKNGTNFAIPYIIVNKLPEEPRKFSSWVKVLRWNKDIIKHLFPKLIYDEIKDHELVRKGDLLQRFYVPNDEEAKKELKIFEAIYSVFAGPDLHKKILKEYIDSFIDDIKIERENRNKLITDEEIDHADYLEYKANCDRFNLHHFVAGLKANNEISWYLIGTNRFSYVIDTNKYDLKNYELKIETVKDFRLTISSSKILTYNDYFGRGMLHHNLTNKRIAIIGLGAIGSSVAESLVRGGVRNLTLWDGDLVEPGNICRSGYSTSNVGDSKAKALEAKLLTISPFCEIKSEGCWYDNDTYLGEENFIHGDFYGNINYTSQEEFYNKINSYDLIIDCTASNELLHFLSYAATNTLLLSLCITNHSHDLLCFSNHDGNPYELRKFLLNRIEQEEGNFYVEGTGCYSPTFLASECDIQVFNNLFVRKLNQEMSLKNTCSSIIWSYQDDYIITDHIQTFVLENGNITLTVTEQTLKSLSQLSVSRNGFIGYLLGGYNTDKNNIYLTHIIGPENANQTMDKIDASSQHNIEYIGEIYVSSQSEDQINSYKSAIITKARRKDINTNNPILASVSADGAFMYCLYIDNEFVPFKSINN